MVSRRIYRPVGVSYVSRKLLVRETVYSIPSNSTVKISAAYGGID